MAALTIGHAIARQTWYLLAAYVGYVVLLAILSRGQTDASELLATSVNFLIAICALLPISGLPNELRSRRTVFVLSKGVSRLEYIIGVAYGHFLLAAGACIATIMTSQPAHASAVFVETLALALLLVSAAVLGVVWLGSRYALIVPAAVFLVPRVPAWLGHTAPAVPHDRLYSAVITGNAASWLLSVLTCVEAILLFAAAAALFERMDIAVAAE